MKKRSPWLAGLFVATTAFIACFPVLGNSFVNGDDRWLFANPVVREAQVAKMLVPRPDRAGYMPVGYLLLTGLYHAGGDRLQNFHLASLLLHSANAALLFFLLLSLMRIASAKTESGALAGSALAAIFYAVHPIHVEAVSVASSLSDLAAAFFALGATIVYLRAARLEPKAGRYRWLAASAALAMLAGLTRWTAAALPAVLTVLDLYPLRRFDRRTALEKIPYGLIGIFVVAANAYAKTSPEAVAGVHGFGLHGEGIVSGIVFYVWKWLVPGTYSLYYILDRPADLMGLSVTACLAALFLTVAVAIRIRKSAPAFPVACAIYLIVLAPVLITTNNGWVLAHNRYAYLPGMALAGLLAAGLLEAWRRRSASAPLAFVAAACVLFGTQARALAPEWHDRSRLWAETLVSDPDAFYSFDLLGEAMLRRKDYGSALQEFTMRLYDHPGDERARKGLARCEAGMAAIALNDEGVALARGGDLDGAVARFKRAVAADPDFDVPRKNLAGVLSHLRRSEKARR